MKARSISALGAIMIIMAAGAIFLSGCASGHKQFVYVVGQGTNEVFAFRAQPDGALAPLGAPNFPAGSNPAGLAAHTSGDFLYIADFSGNDVTLLDINKSNGELSTPVSNSVVTPATPPNIFPAGTGPIAIAMSPTHPFLYVANQGSGDITAYTVDPGLGGLGTVQGSPFVVFAGANITAMTISPKGDFLFVADTANNAIVSFSIGSQGALTQVANSPIFLGGAPTPVSLAIERSGRFLYAADPAHNEVLGFSIGSNGSLTELNNSPFPAGTLPNAVAADPEGALLFAANTGSNNVSAYVIDSSTGALGEVTGSPFATGGQGPAALVVDANSSVVYVTDSTTHDIAALAILGNGTLKPVAGSPFGLPTAGSAIITVRK